MLQKIHGIPSRAVKKLRDASFPLPFPHTLEYSSPARGSWNIVHTGMLLPESHQIYICAAGCLRGVVLTAAEMGAMDRFSTLEVHEKDMVNTDNETFLLEGITSILRRLPKLPRAVLVFTACIHHFLGCNLPYVYRTLRSRFPEVDFAECAMDPIRQTNGITPEERERREIYRLLPPLPRNPKAVNILGSNLPTDDTCELLRLLKDAGILLRDMSICRTYEEFQSMAEASLNIYWNPFTHLAAKDLHRRLGQEYLYLPQCYDPEEILDELRQTAHALHLSLPDFRPEMEKARRSMERARDVIGKTPIAIDASFTFRPFHLARVLLQYGFCVRQIFADAVTKEDEADFLRLREHHGDLELVATKNADLRLFDRTSPERLLALGQKAAYFNDSPYFVNLVEGGGHWGFDGLCRLARLMTDALRQPKDLRQCIRKKGWGGPSCL